MFKVNRKNNSNNNKNNNHKRWQNNNVFLLLCVLFMLNVINIHGKRKKNNRRDRNNMDDDGPALIAGTYCASQRQFKFDPVPPVLKAKKAPKETTMSFCTQFKFNTCCNRTHTDFALLRDRQVAAARMNGECRRQTEYVHCSHCHPEVGTKKIKGICKSLCNNWYKACSIEFFSGGSLSALTPCMDTSLICSRLDNIVSNGEDFCKRMGYVVFEDDNKNGERCYDGSVPQTIGAPDPSEIKSVFERYHTNYDQKYSKYIFAIAWSVVVIFAGGFIYNKFIVKDDDDDFLNMNDDFSSPIKAVATTTGSTPISSSNK